MEYLMIIPLLLSLAGVAFLFIKLKKRLRIEEKLSQLIANEIFDSKIPVDKVSISSSSIKISGSWSSDELSEEEVKVLLQQCVENGVKKLYEQEKSLIEKSLNQPSASGKDHYMKKLINHSIDNLPHRAA